MGTRRSVNGGRQPTPEPVEESAEKLRTNLEEGTASAEDLSQLYFAF